MRTPSDEAARPVHTRETLPLTAGANATPVGPHWQPEFHKTGLPVNMSVHDAFEGMHTFRPKVWLVVVVSVLVTKSTLPGVREAVLGLRQSAEMLVREAGDEHDPVVEVLKPIMCRPVSEPLDSCTETPSERVEAVTLTRLVRTPPWSFAVPSVNIEPEMVVAETLIELID